MRSILITFLAACVLVGSCMAQTTSTINIRPISSDQCTGTGLSWSSQSTLYVAGTTVPTATCIFSDYEVACPTLNGVVPCDTTVDKCVQWNGTNTWKQNDFGQVWSSTTVAPSACLRYGTLKINPDQGVMLVVQPLISTLVFIGLAIAAIIIFRRKVSWFSIFIVDAMCLVGIIQTVSYYYLNAYIVIASGFIALAAYARKTAVAVGFGMFVLLGAFFWVTFATGLGQTQHHSRLMAGKALDDTYELRCNMYYSGFFSIPRVLMTDSDNPQTQYFGYCNRAFLAAQLFLMIVQEYFLILLMAMGAFALTAPKKAEALRTEVTETF